MDVMGMAIVLGLVFFHTAQIFYPGWFPVKNAPPSLREVNQIVTLALVTFTGLWGMPLMFLIAGVATWYSLRKRTVGEFVRERFRRLFVPFVVGLVILVPPQVYYATLQQDPTYHETYVQFYPRFFNVTFAPDFPLFITGAPPDEFFQFGHLWFLLFLFAFTLVLLPLWLYLKSPAGQRLVEQFAAFCTRPGMIFLLALPIAVIEAALGAELYGGWSRYAYAPFIVYGFLLAADARFGQAFHRHKKSARVLGILTFVVYAAGISMQNANGIDPFTAYNPVSVLLRLLKGLSGWLWIVVLMGLAGGERQKQRSRPTGRDSQPRRPPVLLDRIAEYAGEAQLPFYILHMTPIVVIGFYVVQWDASALVKYIVITLSSLVVTLLLCDIGVRRTRFTRFLFGMKQRED
jgi:hypothetical protein